MSDLLVSGKTQLIIHSNGIWRICAVASFTIGVAFLVLGCSPRKAADLHEAIRNGDYDQISMAIASAENINLKDELGNTPLHLVCGGDMGFIQKHGLDPNLVNLMIENGADVNALNKDGQTPLHIAIKALSHPEYQDRLLKEYHKYMSNDGNIDFDHFPLNMIVKSLVENGASVSANSKSGKSPLHLVAGIYVMPYLRNSDPAFYPFIQDYVASIGAYLLSCGSDLESVDNLGYTPLAVAATSGQRELVKVLIEKGANSNVRILGGMPLLHEVSVLPVDASRSLGLLLDAGADINAQNLQGDTALHHSVFCEAAESVELLLKNGIDFQIKNKKGETALDVAKKNADAKDVWLILQKYEK